MESQMFDYFVSELLNKANENRPNLLQKVYAKSKMLSADVDAGFDPIYASVSEKNNASYIGHGICMNKYTGARGKSGASDANAEFVAEVRKIFEANNIADKGMDVIDCGVPVLSMHAPYEVTSKYDLYTAHRAYEAFYRN